MTPPAFETLGNGVTCIDANYVRPGLACLYLLEHGGECAIIETGCNSSLANLQRAMDALGLAAEQVRYVIPTHIHLDHAGGAGAMMGLFPGAQLLVHPKGARHMADPSRLISSSMAVYGEEAYYKLYGDIVPIDAERIIEVEDGAQFSVGGRPLQFLHTPGHADHHFCVWDELSRGWFSGDMFGVSYRELRFPSGEFVMPATTPTQFRPDVYAQSVARLAQREPARMYLTHYGELPFSTEAADRLCAQVAAYTEFAGDYVGAPEALTQRILECALDSLAQLSPPDGAGSYRELLAMDAQLNAQGVMVWLARTLSVPN